MVNLFVEPTKLLGEDLGAFVGLGFTKLKTGVEMRCPVDIHMETNTVNPVWIDTCCPLDEVTYGEATTA